MIFDTFMFNRDFNALKIRLSELYDVVDLFIISESAYTHSGKPKNFHLADNLNQFARYKKKIHLISDSKNYSTRNPRIRESLQRRLISEYFKTIKLTHHDLIIHSDCDEIPRKSVISKLSQSNVSINVLLELNNYSMYLNLCAGKWSRVRVVSGHMFRSIARLRQDIYLYEKFDSRRLKLPIMRVPDFFTHRFYKLWVLPQFVSKPKLQIIENSGWHFNNLFSLNEIVEKIEASSHAELDTDTIKKLARHNNLAGNDLYSGSKLKIVQIDETFPESIRNNQIEWSNFIFKDES